MNRIKTKLSFCKMKEIIWILMLSTIVITLTSCAAMFENPEADAEYQKQMAEVEALQNEAQANLAEAREIEAMAEGPEKEKRKKELEAKVFEQIGKVQALTNKSHDSGKKLSEIDKTMIEMRMESAEMQKSKYKITRALASRVVKIESKDLETKYSDSLKRLTGVIFASGTLEKMEFIDVEMYFVSFSGSNYLYISVFTPTILNTLQLDKYQRLAKAFGVISKDWNEIFSKFMGVTEDFEGYIIEMGYLTKNFASAEFEDVETVSFKISSEDFLKLYNFEITDRQLLDNSLILMDGVRVSPK